MVERTKESVSTERLCMKYFCKTWIGKCVTQDMTYFIWTQCKIVNPKGVWRTTENIWFSVAVAVLVDVCVCFFIESILCSKKGSHVEMCLRCDVCVISFRSLSHSCFGCWGIRQSVPRTIELRILSVSHRCHFEQRSNLMNWNCKQGSTHGRTNPFSYVFSTFFFSLFGSLFFQWINDYGYYCFAMQPIIIRLLALNQMIVQYSPLTARNMFALFSIDQFQLYNFWNSEKWKFQMNGWIASAAHSKSLTSLNSSIYSRWKTRTIVCNGFEHIQPDLVRIKFACQNSSSATRRRQDNAWSLERFRFFFSVQFCTTSITMCTST